MSSLTPFADMGPVPRVELVVEPSDLITDTATVTFQRRAEDRTFHVRGAVRRSASSTMVTMDYEAPFQTESVYEALSYDEDGVYMGATQLDSATLDFDQTVIQQPLDPRLGLIVRRLDLSVESLRRPSPGQRVYPENDGLGRLVGLGPRRGIEDVFLDLLVDSHADADTLQATLGTYERQQLQVWLVRTPPPMRLPRVFFCEVPELVEIDVDKGSGETVRFNANVSEVAPPAPGLSAAVLRHSDIKALFSTHTDVKAVYTLHSDIKRDQSLVGAAG